LIKKVAVNIQNEKKKKFKLLKEESQKYNKMKPIKKKELRDKIYKKLIQEIK
jgi:hypothetical protein